MNSKKKNKLGCFNSKEYKKNFYWTIWLFDHFVINCSEDKLENKLIINYK